MDSGRNTLSLPLIKPRIPRALTNRPEWDERFILGKIPLRQSVLTPTQSSSRFAGSLPYDPLKKIRFKSQSNRTLAKSNSAKSGVSIDTLSQLLDKIDGLWEDNDIHAYFRETFVDSLKSVPKNSAAAILAQECEDLQHGKSSLQIVLKSIRLREECIQDIKNSEHMVKEYDGAGMTAQKLKILDKIIARMQNLQVLSVVVVEGIVKWRESILYNYSEQVTKLTKVPKLPFYVSGQNYIVKMRTDLNFLRNTSYTELLNLAKKRDDPLFILASVSGTNGRVCIPMRSFLKSRIVAAERKIFEEKDYERKVKSEDQKKTDSIQLLKTEYGTALAPAERRRQIRMAERLTRKVKAKGKVALAKVAQGLVDTVMTEMMQPQIVEMMQQALESKIKQNIPQLADEISNGLIDNLISENLPPVVKEKAFEYVNQMAAEQLSQKLLEEAADDLNRVACKEKKNEYQSEAANLEEHIYDMLVTKIDVNDIAQNVLLDERSSEELTLKWIDDLIFEIGDEVIKNEKALQAEKQQEIAAAFDVQNSQICEQIFENWCDLNAKEIASDEHNSARFTPENQAVAETAPTSETKENKKKKTPEPVPDPDRKITIREVQPEADQQPATDIQRMTTRDSPEKVPETAKADVKTVIKKKRIIKKRPTKSPVPTRDVKPKEAPASQTLAPVKEDSPKQAPAAKTPAPAKEAKKKTLHVSKPSTKAKEAKTTDATAPAEETKGVTSKKKGGKKPKGKEENKQRPQKKQPTTRSPPEPKKIEPIDTSNLSEEAKLILSPKESFDAVEEQKTIDPIDHNALSEEAHKLLEKQEQELEQADIEITEQIFNSLIEGLIDWDALPIADDMIEYHQTGDIAIEEVFSSLLDNLIEADIVPMSSEVQQQEQVDDAICGEFLDDCIQHIVDEDMEPLSAEVMLQHQSGEVVNDELANSLIESVSTAELETLVDQLVKEQQCDDQIAEEVADSITEQLLDSEANSITENVIQDTKNDIQGIQLATDALLEMLVSTDVNTIADGEIQSERADLQVCGEISGSMIEKILEVDMDTVAQETLQQETGESELLEKLSSTLIESYITADFPNLIEETVEQSKLDSDLSAQVYDWLLNQLIPHQMEHLAQQTHRRQTKQFSYLGKQNEHIQHWVANELFEKWLSSGWLEDLAETCIAAQPKQLLVHALDHAMPIFTPNVHSPEAYSVDVSQADISVNESTITEMPTVLLDIASPLSISPNWKVSFVPIAMTENALLKAISQYEECLPEMFSQSCLQSKPLINSAFAGYDAQWYWIQDEEGKIIGMMVYNIDYALAIRRVNIVHISTITDEPDVNIPIINSAVDFIYSQDTSNEIRVQIYDDRSYDTPLNHKVKEILDSVGFSWKAQGRDKVTNDYRITMGIEREVENEIQHETPISIRFGTFLQLCDTVPEIQRQLMRAQSSCRSNLLQCILMISDEDLHEPESRVQQDLNELLDVLQTLEEFEFPFLKVGFKDTLQQVLAESNFKPSITPEIMSYLDLSLPWIAGYPAQAHNCEYMVFRHPTVKTWESLDEQQIYLVATSDPLVHLFFLPASTVMRELFRESTAGRHDLFTKIENLVRGIQESSEQCQELWVPKFRKETNEKLNWMMGYAVGKHYIQAGAEQSDVALSMPKCGTAGLVSDSKNALVLTKSFIFGALHTRLSDALEIPKFAMVIDESDFNK